MASLRAINQRKIPKEFPQPFFILHFSLHSLWPPSAPIHFLLQYTSPTERRTNRPPPAVRYSRIFFLRLIYGALPPRPFMRRPFPLDLRSVFAAGRYPHHTVRNSNSDVFGKRFAA
jgi:hypothetical protein